MNKRVASFLENYIVGEVVLERYQKIKNIRKIIVMINTF